MTIRRALSTIRLTQWADVKPLLRVRVEHRAARPPYAAALGRELGQGLVLQATIVLEQPDGEATVAIPAAAGATWKVPPEDIWASAAVNTCRAAPPPGNRVVTETTHHGWRLTFVLGCNQVSTYAVRMLDRPLANDEAPTAIWWSVLSPLAMVLMHPLGRACPADEAAAKLLVAGLASVTDRRLPANLFSSCMEQTDGFLE